MGRGFARPGADLGADSGADFIFERRGILGRLPPHMFAFRKALDTLSKIRYLLQERPVVCGPWAVTKPTKQVK